MYRNFIFNTVWSKFARDVSYNEDKLSKKNIQTKQKELPTRKQSIYSRKQKTSKQNTIIIYHSL